MAIVGLAYTAITGAVGAALSSGVGAFLTKTLVGRLLTSVALSALKTALIGKPDARQSGIRTQNTQTGGITPASFILGKYATEGQLNCPPMSHGNDGETPNAYLTYVIELGDIAGQQLDGLILDGERVELGTEAHADYGTPILGRFTDYAWVKYYDGAQTAADPMLLDKYGDYPDRPWTATHVGAGICYAIVTFRFNREIFSGFPKVRFEMVGIPLYDPRKDSTVGGSGNHRWLDKSTWQPSENVAVQIYNIKRGIDLGSGDVWGGGADAEDLPLASWWAAMNQADVSVALAAGGIEPQWRSSFEVFVDDQPATVIDDMLRGCAGQTVENGGVWKIRIGGPGLPLYFFTDEDVILSEPEENIPFSASRLPFNAVQAVYPEPRTLWEPKDAPALLNAAYEAQDGGQRRVAGLSLPATPYDIQVQRVQNAYLEDERRFRQHVLNLPPEASPLEPLDVVVWTSAANGYDTKSWDISSQVDPLTSGTPQFRIREVDQSDYDWSPQLELPVSYANTNRTPLAPQAVAGFGLNAVVIQDENGEDRRVALEIVWNGTGQDDVRGLKWEVRRVGTTDLTLAGFSPDAEVGAQLVDATILPITTYEARGQWIVDRPTEWTGWVQATTADVGLGFGEISEEARQQFAQDAFDSANALFDFALDTAAEFDLDERVSRLLDVAETEGKVEVVRNDLTVELGDARASIEEVRTVAVTTEGALAQAVQTLTTSIGNVSGAVTTVATSLSELDGQFSQYQTTVAGQFEAQTAYVDQNFYTKTDADQNVAAAITTVNTTVGDLSATVQQVQTSVNATDLLYGVRLTNNGVASGFYLQSELKAGGTVASNMVFDADYFAMGTGAVGGPSKFPFQIRDGEVFLTKASIKNADIDTLKIAGNAVIQPEANTRNDTITGDDTWQVIQSETIFLDVPSTILVNWNGAHSYLPGAGLDYRHDVRFKIGSAYFQQRGGVSIEDYPALFETFMGRFGVITIEVEWKAGSLLQVQSRTISVFGIKR